MKVAQFAIAEYVSAAILNAAQGADISNVAALGVATATPGITSIESMALSSGGLVVTANLPAPFGILFPSGDLVQAHGSLTNADSQTYNVSFSGIVSASGSVTAYLLAASGQIQQNPYQVLGPPPGHPDYNPSFVPYTAYATLVDTLLLSASSTPADNATTFELARYTLATAATGVGAANTNYCVVASTPTILSPVSVSGNVQLLATNSGTLYNALNALTYTLPPVAGLNGVFFGLGSSTLGAVSVQVSGVASIYGNPAAPASGVSTFAIAQGTAPIIVAVNGQWQILGPQVLTKLPTQNGFVSGSGEYTPPAGCRRIVVTRKGAGGGGGNGNTDGGRGSDGEATTFNGVSAAGGLGGGAGNIGDYGYGGAGGTSAGAGTRTMGLSGTNGASILYPSIPIANTAAGGGGSLSGQPPVYGYGGNGGNLSGEIGPASGGGGGGQGETVVDSIDNPVGPYAYSIGVAGNQGTSGTGSSNASPGQGGAIIIDEYY